MNCEEIRSQFVDAYYQEMDAQQRENFHQHLKQCSACAAEFEKIVSTLDLMKERKQMDPGEEFWNGYYDRLQSRMERSQQQPVISFQPRHRMAWISQIAAAVILVGIGVIIGKFYFNQTSSKQTAIQTTPPVVADANVQKAQLFLQRSQVLLLGVVNADENDLSRQKEISHELITQASTLKNDLKEPQYRKLRALISELEVILLEISNLEQQSDVRGVELVRSGVDRKGVLLKINLEQMRLSEKADEPKHPDSKL